MDGQAATGVPPQPLAMMMNFLRWAATVFFAAGCAAACAQTVNNSQAVTLEGLLTSANHGAFKAAAFEADGSLVLLIDEHDGLRLERTDATATTVLATAHIGASGDSGLAMALDPSGNIYVTGTSTSGTLTGTSGTAFPTRADTSTNSFLAKFDTNLNEVFLTFLGTGRTSAMGVAATADAAFVTGLTYSTTFPVTAGGIQQMPASGTSGNGFVERFSTAGTLVYATYLTGAGGDTTPAAIAADATDAAMIVGSTAASGYPTVAGLVPQILGTTSGFATKLTAAGDGITWSTFIPGSGLTSVAVDASSNTVWMSGNVALGQFPVATVTTPLAATSYQSLIRLSADGQTVVGSEVLVPGTQSFVSVGSGGTAWVSGSLGTPLFPGSTQPDYPGGDSFLLHVTVSGAIDQTLRFGGVPADNTAYATLSSVPAAPAISGSTVFLPATLTAAVTASLLGTERFDLPLANAPNTVLPNTLRDVVATCSSGQCSGTAGLLAEVSTAASAPSLSLSIDDLPNLTLRNLGSATATGVVVTATGFTVATNCGTTLDPSNQCSLALAGNGPGSITVSAANASSYTVSLPATSLTPDALALSTDELDFGIATSSSPVTRTVTVTNLTGATQTFSSALDHAATTAYKFTESSSDCSGTAPTHTLAANSSCHINLTLTPSSTASNDGVARLNWLIGTRDVVLTGFAEAAALSLSATEVDFGVQYSGPTALRAPRYLYLSNNSATALAHATVTLPAASPFTATDQCPTTLEPHTVCGITLGYNASTSPSKDTATLNIDGATVLLTGTTLPPAGTTGSTANLSLMVTPASVNFSTAVVVTGVAGSTQNVTVKNTGSAAIPLTVAITGDFTLNNGCPSMLSANASCTLVIGFAPSQPGTRQGLLAITGGTGFAPTYVALSGSGSAIFPVNNGVVDMGQTYVGQPLVQWYKISQPLTRLTAVSSNPIFGVAIVEDTGNGHGTLPASAFTQTASSTCSNCYVGVQFLSGTAGPQSATLSLNSVSGGNAYSVTLTATALPVSGLILTPMTQDFGPVSINSSSAPITFTVADLLTSSTAVTVQSVTANGDFNVSTNATGGASCSGLLASTSSCYVNVVFSPTAMGQRSGTLTVVTDAGTITATLTGYGLADPGVALNPTALVFNDVPGTTATQQTVAISNTSSNPITVGTVAATGTGFSAASTCGTLAAGAICSVTVVFTPQPATSTGILSIPITATMNGQSSITTYSVPLSSTYTSANTGLQILPNLANFGGLATGSLGLTRQFTLNNFTGKTVNVTLNIPRQFPLADPGAACATLAPGTGCVFSVSFLPSTSGEATGTVTATASPADDSAAGNALAYMIGYGQGSGALTLSGNLTPDAPLNFGQVASGQTAQQTVTVTNSGITSVTVHRITSLPPFYSTSTCGAALLPNATCMVTLTYAPINEVASGSYARTDNSSLVLENDATASPTSLALTGTAASVVTSNPSSGSVLDSFALSESALTFANTAVGDQSAAQTVILTNSGTTTLHIAAITPPTDFTATTSCATVMAGQNCTITVLFSPTTATSSSVRSGTLEISSDASTSLEFVSLLGASSAAPLTLSPVALDFGSINLGLTSTLNITVANTSATPITLGALASSGDYSAARGTCPASGATLAAGSSCAVSVTFKPSATGTRSGTLSLASDATQVPLTVSLTGVGASSNLIVNPNIVSFGPVAVTATANSTLTLTNTGTVGVTGIATSITGANAPDFAVSSPCSVTQLAANQACTLTVRFTPSAVGNESATLNITSSDPHSPLTVALSGTGLAGGGSFLLTVNGASSANDIVSSGTPASYTLTLTPINGFTGTVALTCTPITPAQYAACSLLPSSVNLNGAQATSTATITTLTTAMIREVGGGVLFCLMLPWLGRRRRSTLRSAAATAVLGLIALSGCGHSTTTVVNNGPTNLRYAPAGTYSYQVTASSTTGSPNSQTVTLNLTIN